MIESPQVLSPLHPPAPTLQVAVLGPPDVRCTGQPLALARRQSRALLYRLAAAPHPVPREQLGFLFWPDVSETTARRNLTVLLNHLRRALPVPEALVAVGDSIVLDRNAIWSDAATLAEAVTTSRRDQRPNLLAEAVDLYRGPFLDGFTLPAHAEWEDWAMRERQAWERRYLQALATLIEAHTARGEYQAAITMA